MKRLESQPPVWSPLLVNLVVTATFNLLVGLLLTYCQVMANKPAIQEVNDLRVKIEKVETAAHDGDKATLDLKTRVEFMEARLQGEEDVKAKEGTKALTQIVNEGVVWLKVVAAALLSVLLTGALTFAILHRSITFHVLTIVYVRFRSTAHRTQLWLRAQLNQLK